MSNGKMQLGQNVWYWLLWVKELLCHEGIEPGFGRNPSIRVAERAWACAETPACVYIREPRLVQKPQHHLSRSSELGEPGFGLMMRSHP